jgi:isoamylase
VLRDNRWPTGQPDEDDRRDLAWYSVWGLPMTEEEWTNPSVRCIAALFDGRFAPVDGQPSPSVLLLFNASDEAVVFTLPEAAGHERMAGARRHRPGPLRARRREAVQPQAKIELRVARDGGAGGGTGRKA